MSSIANSSLMREAELITKRIGSWVRESAVYAAARRIRRCLWEVKKEIKERKAPEKRVITLYPVGPPKGRVLFSYIIDGFLLEPGTPIPKRHTNIWQSLKMVETFVELGYEVDVIHWTNTRFIPNGNYSFLVDVRRNLERLAPLLNKDCTKIMHCDTAHILFHNAAEAKRLLELQERRGVTLQPRRFEMPNLGIEHADYATSVGNDFTVDTFKYANKKNFRLPHPCGLMLDWPKREWNQCQNNFLWFSSGGFVHKGLDLALEAFSKMPECHLTVCAPVAVDREKDFVGAYYKELYETRNIKTVGWVDVDSSKFIDIIAACAVMLHLSCAEGGGAAVKMCMHAGLIPVVSYESGVDVHDFGFTLKDCSVANIINTIRHIMTLSQNELQNRSRKAWKFARRCHTRENFAREYRKVILEIIAERQTLNRKRIEHV
jgi:glycosyltransferase involved in cell wall biosynthesis